MPDEQQRNKDNLRRFLQALCVGDLANVEASITDDMKLMTMGTSLVSVTRSRAQIADLCRNLRAITESGIELRFVSFTAEADRVSCEMEGRSTLVNGMPYNNIYHLLAHFRDGKLCLLKEYLDTKHADAALGPFLGR